MSQDTKKLCVDCQTVDYYEYGEERCASCGKPTLVQIERRGLPVTGPGPSALARVLTVAACAGLAGTIAGVATDTEGAVVAWVILVAVGIPLLWLGLRLAARVLRTVGAAWRKLDRWLHAPPEYGKSRDLHQHVHFHRDGK